MIKTTKRYMIVRPEEIEIGRCDRCGKIGMAIIKIIEISTGLTYWRCKYCVRNLTDADKDIYRKLATMDLERLKKSIKR